MKIIHGISEKDLIVRLKCGDQTAFELLFHYYYPGLVVYSSQFIADQDEAEEIVQEFFVRFWQKHQQMNVCDSLKNYFFSSIRNSSLNFLKHKKIEEKYLKELIEVSRHHLVYEPDLYIISELQEKIKNGIDRLPEQCRKIFTIPKFLMERCDILLEKAGLGTSLYFVAKTVGTFVGAILLVKLSGRKFFIVSMLVAIPALLVMLLIGNLWGILSIVFILGFAIANVFSIIFSAALKKFPDVPRFQDFRQMFDKMGKNIDAVSVGTPDCSHFPITMLTIMSKIKGYCLLVFVIIALHLFSCSQQEKLLVDFVDPFIGTADDHGQTDPSANVPFGMIKPGPDTDPGGHGGYDFYARDLRGFSQTRFSGTGCNGVGGNLRVLPFCGKITETIEMDKTTEVARAGYYAVELFNGVKTEITADRTSAIYHFSFPSSLKSGLSIDFNSSFSKFLQEEHDLVGKQAVEGKVKCSCTCNLGSYEFYYYLETDKLPDTVTEQEGKLLWTFESAKDGQVILKIGLSSVSTNDARNNLKTEIGNKTFEQVKQAAGEKWEKLLGVIFVKTGNDSLKRLFYTNLYHACQTPFNIVDHTGTFRGSDGRVYTTSGQSYYHGWSIWDTFRTKYSLFSLLYPEEYKDMMSSLVKLYRQGKVDWATEKEPFLTTRTEHSVIVLLDAFRKGLLRDSLEPVLPFFLDEAKQLSGTSPDKILERCYDYWGISGIAGELGIPNIENQFLKKSKEYRDVWIEKFLKMGEFSDIMHGGGLYEGTLWQYRWFVPHDQDWMVSAIGGREKTIEELDYFFNNNLFNIGNQPDIHVPFLYYYLGEPWKSQKLVQKILLKPTVNYYGTHKKWGTPYNGKVFKADPEGYLKEMDDDAGTMSSWFVLSSLGLYPVCPGTPMYWILPPVFDSVSIDVGEGKHFDIKAKRSGEQDIFIRKAILNNENITRSWINYEEIKRGGELILELDSVPNKQWGRECPEIN